MKQKIEAYLKSKEFAWSPSTMKSERARLWQHAEAVNSDPEDYHVRLTNLKFKTYTIKTIFIRLADFDETGRYREFLKTNRRKFLHAYQKKEVTGSFQEARERIADIHDDAVKRKALQLLNSGARWTESHTLDDQGVVIGKGGKRRRLYNVEANACDVPYSKFVRILKQETGYTPHDLRKLFATHLLNSGLPIHEVKDILGHASIQTTERYLQTKTENERAEVLRKLVG
jgi:integrase